MSVVGYTSNEMWSMLKGIYTLEYSGHQYTNYIGFTDEDYHTIEKDLDSIRDLKSKHLLNQVRLGLKFLLVRSKYNPYKNK